MDPAAYGFTQPVGVSVRDVQFTRFHIVTVAAVLVYTENKRWRARTVVTIMNNRLKYLLVTCSTSLVVLLLLGAAMGNGADPEEPYRHLGVFSEVLSRIKSDYVEEPDVKNVAVGALNGLLESLDPYASYLNADQYKQWLNSKDNQKAGVGLVLSKKYGYVGVVGAIPGSPADKAGIGSLDMIEAIKGVSTRDMPLAYADLLLHGEPGSTVEVQVLRLRNPEPQKITLTRASVKLPPVTHKMLQDGVGQIQVQSLEAGKSAQAANAVAELEKQGAKKLVLDLRDASFGVPEEGIALADLFLEKGLIAYLEGQKVHRQDFQASPSKGAVKLPLVVITNRGTASGAELAAAALLDNKRAEIVGERTYGDAAVRKTLTMDDGSAVILSVAKYHSPSGKAIQDTGVLPVYQLTEAEAPEDTPDDQNAQPPAPAPKPQEDTLLKKAVEVLTKGSAASDAKPAAAKPNDGPNKERLPLTPLNVPQP
jgi:carboxyl-terminal processing protease